MTEISIAKDRLGQKHEILFHGVSTDVRLKDAWKIIFVWTNTKMIGGQGGVI